mgnify:CR=1 FL=1
MLEEWLLLALGGGTLIFVYSKLVYYSSLYGKIKEEHDHTKNRNVTVESLLTRYEGQVESSVATMVELQNTIKLLRMDIKEVTSQNKMLKRQLTEYKSKAEFLYEQIEKTT